MLFFKLMFNLFSNVNRTLLLLTLCLVSAQWVYGAHAGEYSEAGHVHAIDCTVCLAEHHFDVELSQPLDFNKYFTYLECYKAAASACFTAASTQPAIRAPPVSTY